MANYAKGANFERRVRKSFTDRGYFVIRSAGSKSPVDLMVIAEPPLALQCKRTCSNRNAGIILADLHQLLPGFMSIGIVRSREKPTSRKPRRLRVYICVVEALQRALMGVKAGNHLEWRRLG